MGDRTNTVEAHFRTRASSVRSVRIHWDDADARPDAGKVSEAILDLIPEGSELLLVRQFDTPITANAGE